MSDIDWVVGEYCIVRCRGAGVHAGVIEAVSGDCVLLQNARRIWRWSGGRLSCSELAESGPGSGSRLAVGRKKHVLRDWVEIIPCSAEARAVIERHP